VLGIDDSPFSFHSEKVLVVGVVARLPGYLEGVMRTECSVDGKDANTALIAMINASRYKEQLKLVMIDGIALGGFNVVDISELCSRTGIPFCTITRDKPDLRKMEGALRQYFPDWRERLEVITRHPLHEVRTSYNSLYAAVKGMDIEEARSLIEKSTVRGALPEPLRMAHLIATAMVKGESRGRA